ncbi:hypothetical protein COOONC_25509 [Cooperia oncophora]
MSCVLLREAYDFIIYSSIELEYRGHDPQVLKSYTKFLESVCTHLNLTRGRFEVLPYVRWIQPALRSKFVHKKYKLHYETRTHITKFEVSYFLTFSRPFNAGFGYIVWRE